MDVRRLPRRSQGASSQSRRCAAGPPCAVCPSNGAAFGPEGPGPAQGPAGISASSEFLVREFLIDSRKGNVGVLGNLLWRDRAMSVLSLLSWSVLKVGFHPSFSRHGIANKFSLLMA